VVLTVAEGLIAGLGVGLAAGALDLPAPSALGLTAGLMALLPHLGLVLGSIPFLLLVLGLRSDAATIAVAVVVVACQLVDSVLVRPRIASRSVHIGLLVPWVVTLIGYTVYGVGGAAYGLAFAVFGLAAVDEIGGHPPTDDAPGDGGGRDSPAPGDEGADSTEAEPGPDARATDDPVTAGASAGTAVTRPAGRETAAPSLPTGAPAAPPPLASSPDPP
jgi:hypothetical protein